MATPSPPLPSHGSRDWIEREWQFEAVDLRPVERWLRSGGLPPGVEVAALDQRDLVDVYVDTEDRRIHRAGYSVRLRTTASGPLATMKARSDPAEGGPRERREIEQALRHDDPAGLASGRGPVAERVRTLAGRRRLVPMAEVRTSRRSFALSVDGRVVAEVSLDATVVPLDGEEAPARLQRVEVEATDDAEPPGGPAAVETFVEELRTTCGLHPATTTKLEAALVARGVPPPGGLDLGPTAVHDGMTVAELAFATTRRHFSSFLAHEAGSRLGEDPEEVHDMRVATRRLRAALSLFRDTLPVRSRRFREELRWAADALGGVRDLDVQLEQLSEWSAADPADAAALAQVTGLMERRREVARRALLRALNSRRYDRLVDSFTGFLRRGPSLRHRQGRTPALAAAPGLIRRRHRGFRRAGDAIGPESEAAAYHDVRIRGKRLRYALEFVKPLYPEPAEELVRRLVAVQDTLGLHQDAEVAVEQLRALVAEHGGEISPEAVFALGRVAERYSRRIGELRAEFPKVYRRVRGRPWKDLRREMARRARASGADPSSAQPPPSAGPAEAGS